MLKLFVRTLDFIAPWEFADREEVPVGRAVRPGFELQERIDRAARERDREGDRAEGDEEKREEKGARVDGAKRRAGEHERLVVAVPRHEVGGVAARFCPRPPCTT